ncbi:MAG: hypothetical protein ACYS9C_14835, partial [Planctomycetota bacterium]|jgi:hypothetical protein
MIHKKERIVITISLFILFSFQVYNVSIASAGEIFRQEDCNQLCLGDTPELRVHGEEISYSGTQLDCSCEWGNRFHDYGLHVWILYDPDPDVVVEQFNWYKDNWLMDTNGWFWIIGQYDKVEYSAVSENGSIRRTANGSDVITTPFAFVYRYLIDTPKRRLRFMLLASVKSVFSRGFDFGSILAPRAYPISDAAVGTVTLHLSGELMCRFLYPAGQAQSRRIRRPENPRFARLPLLA